MRQKYVIYVLVTLNLLQFGFIWFNESQNNRATKPDWKELFRTGQRSAIDVSRSECDNNDPVACLAVGMFYDNNTYDSPNYLKAKEFKKKSCELGSLLGCYYLGIHLIPTDKDYIKRGEYFKKACDEGDVAPACNNYALYLKNTAYNMDTILEYTEKSCRLSGANGCYNTGKALSVKKDYKSAYDYYIKSCDMGLASGCSNAGYLVEKNTEHFSKTENDKVIELFKKACDNGDDGGCLNYANKLDINDSEKVAIYKRLKETEEMSSYGHYGLACIFSKKGEKEEAINELKKTLFEKPELINEILNDKDLDNIRNLPEFDEIIESAKCCLKNKI
jgi:TPR repeat protein